MRLLLRPLLDRLAPLRGAHRQTGRSGERLAARHLKRAGYRVLARNLRNRLGEADLLAEASDGTVVIVEIKAGQRGAAHRPEQHVNAAKQRKLVALAASLARQHGLTQRRLRFDVIAVEFAPDAKPTIRHHVGAFQSAV